MHEKIGYDLKSFASHLTYPFFVSISLLIYIFAKLAAEPPNLCRKKWDSIIKVHRTEILNSPSWRAFATRAAPNVYL
jgi:hypothetical protein